MKKIRVSLINPPVLINGPRKSMHPIIENLFFNSPPLGLAYLAAVLEKNNVAVMIIDGAVENSSASGMADKIDRFGADIVGITSTTNLFDSAVKTACFLKEKNPLMRIVLGGAHVTANPEHAMSFTCFDVGVLGEGEITFIELIKAMYNGEDMSRVDGIIFRENNKFVFTKRREYIDNLDLLPFPARHLLPMRRYRPQPNDINLLPKLSIISSRGCPYHCIFCDKNIFGRQYRSFSPAYIVSEIEHLIADYGAKDIAFLDSTFSSSEERVLSIIEEIKKRKVKVGWTCTVRADIMTKDLLREMKNAGCWRIRLGAESGNDSVLRFIGKGITKQQISNVARWAHQLNLQPKGFFMIGHLTDSKETIKDTVKFARSLPFKDITVQINTPLPNTAQFRILDKYGTLIKKDYRDHSFWQPVFIPNGLTIEYLNWAYRYFYRSFYLRPVILWRHFSRIRTAYNLVKYIWTLPLVMYLFFNKQREEKREPA